MHKQTNSFPSWLLTVLLLVMLSSFGWAQAVSWADVELTPEPPTPAPPPEWVETVTYSGVVLSPSQAALPDVIVSANPTDPTVPGSYGFTALTDGSGRFSLLLTPTVEYRIWVSYSGVGYYYHPDGLKVRPEDSALITPQYGENRSDLLIHWLEPVTFSGTVTGTDSQGIGSIQITAEVASQDAVGPYGIQTQADGYYTLNVPAGLVYRLSASSSLPDQPYQKEYYQDATEPAQAVLFDSQAAGTTTFSGIDFQLEELPSFYISGVIRDEQDQPLQGITIAVQNQTNPGETIPPAQSDAQGHYRVRLEPGDSYIFYLYGSNYPYVYYNGSDYPPVRELAEPISGAAGEERTLDYQYQAPANFSGSVTNLAGEALEGVGVAAYEKTTASYITGVTTQADGSFSLTVPGGYDYAFSAGPVYGSTPLRKEYYPNQSFLEMATYFYGTPGGAYTALAFYLDPAFRITGKVTGPDGSRMANVPVQVDALYEGGTGSITQTTTDGNGEYDVSIIEPVNKVALSACAECAGYPYQKLYYTASGGLPISSLAEIIVPQVGQIRTGVDFHFRQPISFSGLVQDTHGSPVQGAWISVQEVETRQEITGGVTGADGRYTLHAPPGMAMRLSAWPGDRAQRLRWEYYDNQATWESALIFDGQTPGAIYSGRDFIFEPLPTTSVSGVVHGPDGSPLAGVRVIGSSTNWYATSDDVATGADGRYRLTLDGNQPYTIQACASCSQLPYGQLFYHKAGNTPIQLNAQTLTGADGQERSGIDFQFAPPVVIRGQVTSPDGSPLAGNSINAEDAAGNAWLGGASTDSQGRYTLYLEPGYPFRMSIYPYVSGMILPKIYYPGQSDRSQASIFEGEPGERFESIDFLVEKVLTITGKVSGPNGAPLFNVRVECEQEGENDSCGCDITNSMGVYTLRVQPGRPYRIAAGGYEVNGLVYSRVYSNGTPLRSKAETLIGGAGETLGGVDFQLVPAVTVSGHVYAPGGSPLMNVWVLVLGETDLDELGSANTAVDGSYSAYIHPGLSYTVKADPGSQPYTMEYFSDSPNRAQAAILTGDDRQGIDFTLNPPAVLRGWVTQPGGSPVFEPRVRALDATTGELLGSSYSREDGSYIMYLRSGHAYRIQVVSWDVDHHYFLVEYYDNRHARDLAAVVQMGLPGTERVLNFQVDPVAVANQTALVGHPFTYTLSDAGPDLTFAASLVKGADLPAWLQFNPATRTFNGTPAPHDAGRLNILITVSYDNDRQAVRTFILKVANPVPVFLPVVRR